MLKNYSLKPMGHLYTKRDDDEFDYSGEGDLPDPRLRLSSGNYNAETGIWKDLSGHGRDFHSFYDPILEAEFLTED